MHAYLCLAHNSSLMLQAFSVEESLFSILTQSRSRVREVGNWGILNPQIFIYNYFYETMIYFM